MTRSNNQGSSNRPTINEGIVKKGGVNKPPSSPRPAPPIGQGGSNSSNQGSSGSSKQGDSNGTSK